MRSIQNWSIRRRLVLAFAGVLIPYLALVLVGLVGFRIVGQRFQAIRGEVETELAWAADLQVALTQLVMPPNDYLITGEVAERERFEQRLTRGREILARLETAHGAHVHPEELELLGVVRDRLARIETLGREILAVPDPLVNRAARVSMRALDQLGDESTEVLSRFRRIGMREIQEEIEGGQATTGRVAVAGLLALGLSVAGGVVLALFFARWLSRPLRALAEGSRRMAAGDLSPQVDTGAGGELGETARAFNTMAERLEASHAALRRTNEELAAINSIGGALTSTLEPREVFKILTQRTAQAVGAERCSLNLWREGHVVPIMSQFADGHSDPALWEKFKAMGPYRLEEVPVHAEAIRTRRPVAIQDATTSPLYPAYWVEAFGVRSALVVPLVRHDRVIGTLNLDRTRGPYRWSQDQIDQAMTIAGQAALAVENARLYDETREREQEATKLFRGLTLLNQATRTLHRTLEVESMLSGALKELAKAFGAGAALANTLSETGELQRSVGHWLSEDHGRDVSFRVKGGISALLRETREPLILRDIAERPEVVHPAHFRHGVKSLAAFPLIGKSQHVLGILFLFYTEPQAFPESEVRLLTAYAEQLATALENARLYEESEARRRTAEALAAVGRDVAQSLDLAVVSQRISKSIRELLGVQVSALYRREPGSENLVALAMSGDERLAHEWTPVLPRGTGMAGLAVRERRAVVTADLLNDPRIAVAPEAGARLGQSAFRAVLAVPLLVGDVAIGALAVRAEMGRLFTEEEVRLAQAFADQAALALENARLFEEAQRATSDLKAAQEQLIQGATMRALGELASGAAHHLNNLMAIVLGRVRLLLAGPAAASARRPLEIIERAAMDASEVVRRVSRFARTQPMEEWQPLDLRQLAGEVLELTRARWQDAAQAQGIPIEAGLEGPDVPPIMGNGTALREVLINLVLNAVEALPDGGKITVKAFVEDGWAGLAVSDTGVGMSPEVRGRVLEPFFTTKGPRSTGLGLSAAYGILQRHGGKLEIESKEGRGTTVTVRLPVQSPLEGERPRAEPARGGAPAIRILVIDDDDEVREVVAEMLGAEGHAVLQARGGRQGLGLLEAGEKVDLVLTDLGMPEMNGWDVARAIRARWPGLPVGMLTGWGEQIDESSEDRRMVAGVLSKPAPPEGLREFVAACRSAMGGK